MKKTIAIVAGGDQSEVVVSLKSAQGLYSFIDKEKYNLYVVIVQSSGWRVQLPDGQDIPIDKNDFSFELCGNKVTFDCAYITIHGIPGEDGKLQGYFDMIGMPYSCCDVLAAALTFNKFTCNNYLKSFGVKVADSILLRKKQTIDGETVAKQLGLPCFIKPNIGGSSFGVTKVKNATEVADAIQKAFAEGDQVIIESFMQGIEITCGIYKTDTKEVVFPITEVVSENEFFDFDAKYKGQVQEITPARISADLSSRVQQLTSSIYDILGCKGIVRIDYIITEGDTINLLEVNTTPGMTTTSFIPQQINAAGLAIKDVMTDVIEYAIAMK
ncbi:MAG: D-alanine--D-alanine ligase [Paludibacteraceae bacterium]|nr:D-alanine--D-alanine ligase [Paludibacteraceae bacterium]MBN2787526.1 D-alanine--D-alanine ligase [Paludibacteraceae bacterium]